MIELNSNSFRLEYSLSIVNSITFFRTDDIHILTDCSLFKSYQEQHRGNVSLTDDSTREIKSTERINLRMTSGKVLTLQDVMHVSALQRNLISESSLLRADYRIVKESNKFVISKSNVFIRKNFVSDGLFRLNVINSSDNKIFIPVDLNIEPCDIWHGRLGHVNFQFYQKSN